MIPYGKLTVKGCENMLEWFWYTLAATLAGVGTGLVGLSAATAMVPILPVLRRGDRSLSGHGHRAGLGHPGVRRDYRYIHQSQEYRPEARLDHAGLHYWATTAQASPWPPTPTSLGRCRRRPPKGWAASWPRRYKKSRKGKRKYRASQPGTSSKFLVWVLFGSKIKCQKPSSRKSDKIKENLPIPDRKRADCVLSLRNRYLRKSLQHNLNPQHETDLIDIYGTYGIQIWK